MQGFRILVVRRRHLWLGTVLVLCLCALGVLTRFMATEEVPVAARGATGYVVFAMNDLGMHCIQSDYSSFLVLPPGNTIKVQVFRKAKEKAYLITDGITVTYEIVDNTTSADKTNFWTYAKGYGYDVPPNVGISGNGLSGTCTLSSDRKYYEATYIPVVPYNDGSTVRNPYQLARITVTGTKSGAVLGTADKVVVPVSDEMECATCHGKTGTDLNILTAHDKRSKTQLVADLQKGIRRKCAECHQDNILGEKGKPGLPSLSLAIHGSHADRMSLSPYNPSCSSCHPGPATKCYRGVMAAGGVKCGDPRCHGGMAQVAQSQRDGRQAWLQEPECSQCHGSKYAVNASQLYRNSYLRNAPASDMNNLIQCQSCHNSTHAEWKSTLALDNALPISLLGYASYINKCTVCHEGKGKMHR